MPGKLRRVRSESPAHDSQWTTLGLRPAQLGKHIPGPRQAGHVTRERLAYLKRKRKSFPHQPLEKRPQVAVKSRWKKEMRDSQLLTQTSTSRLEKRPQSPFRIQITGRTGFHQITRSFHQKAKVRRHLLRIAAIFVQAELGVEITVQRDATEKRMSRIGTQRRPLINQTAPTRVVPRGRSQP